MKKACFCTIISCNYIDKAKNVFDSLLQFYPGSKFDILITNYGKFDLPEDSFVKEHFNIHTVDELNIPDFEQYMQTHDPSELNTLVKPKFLQKLLETEEKVIFTDSDIFYYSDIDDIIDLLDSYNVILTPHRLFDEKENLNSLKMLQYGYYNLGFLAVKRSDETRRFLEWWDWRTL